MRSPGSRRTQDRPTFGPVLDAVLVAGWTVLAVVSLPVLHFGPRPGISIDAGAVALVLVAGAATAVRRRWPRRSEPGRVVSC